MRILLTILSLIPWIGLSQYSIDKVEALIAKGNEQKLVTESAQMILDGYYYFAEPIVDKLLTIQPDNSNYKYRKGYLLLYSKNDIKGAINYFENSKKNINNKYDFFSKSEKNVPADVLFHLAKSYHLNEELDKAINHYQQFIKASNKNSVLIEKAQLGIAQCENAMNMMKTPKNSKIKNIETPLNSKYPEYAPVISLDGTSLYFTSRRPWKNNETENFRDVKTNHYPEDIYLSLLQSSNTWSTPEKMTFCTPEINEATITISTDEKQIYVYQDVSGGGDIYYSDFQKSKFQVIEQLDIQGINTEAWETHCSISPDGKTIYFTSDRPGGYGGRDIYRVIKLADGSWSQPQNLGPNINTPYDEEAPFIFIDNKTLYFASNGKNSMGGFDIFVSVKDKDGMWSEPINLGYPINSTADDIFYTTTANGKKSYLSSARKGGNGEQDIYEIEHEQVKSSNIIVLKGNIHPKENNTIDENTFVMIQCISCKEAPQKLSLRPRDGAFIKQIEPCSDYEITFIKNGNEVISKEKFSTSCDKQFEEIIKSVNY